MLLSEFAAAIGEPIDKARLILQEQKYSQYIDIISDDKFVVSSEILKEFEIDNTSKATDSQQITADKATDSIITSEYIEYLKEQIRVLQEENKAKESTIKELTQIIISMTQSAQELADKALTTTSQAQHLQAAEYQKKKTFLLRLFGRKE